MMLVCICSALLVAVSVGMVIEAHLMEQEQEQTRQARFGQHPQYGCMFTDNEVDDAAAQESLIRQQREIPRHHTSCHCQGLGPAETRSRPAVLRAAVWMNKFVGIDALRHTDVYTAQERESLPTICGNLFFALPRLCTNMSLGPLRLSTRRAGDVEAVHGGLEKS
ncbi:uncharacterized protein B0I36DRAFT_319203 [Microdochium trichocladiopsis]|uniref:Secreted protein n=1 Tax=Microdochium trichocladiopsis TaxID=1682393 RepID=A0A9P8YF43_9PEZI|nr:uncharacterized protein B0I36DRAFT_319203 [Microdochium trichocladiopsis]KAH7035847.1 hypothetical protein B0I36DRAFT_319203 [Microdochium trichocladiopsis]